MKVVKCIKHDELLVEFGDEFGVPYEVVISYHINGTGERVLFLVMEERGDLAFLRIDQIHKLVNLMDKLNDMIKRGYELKELVSVSV